MQSETGFPSSHQLKSYVASKSRLKLAARAVRSADAGLPVWLVGLGFIIRVRVRVRVRGRVRVSVSGFSIRVSVMVYG